VQEEKVRHKAMGTSEDADFVDCLAPGEKRNREAYNEHWVNTYGIEASEACLVAMSVVCESNT